MATPFNRPKISVIMAVYNGSATLPETFESLKNQTYKNFEVVVVDDGSKDNSKSVVQSFMAAHPHLRIFYHFQKNKGLGGARNSAMRASQGEILCLLDQDDIWYPSKLEKVVCTFEKNPEFSFVTHHLYRRVASRITEELRCDFQIADVFDQLLFHENYFCGSAMSFKRDVLEKNGYFNEEDPAMFLSEDFDYWLRAAKRGLQFFVLKEILGEYVVHNANFSKNRLRMLKNEWYVVKKYYRERAKRRWSDPFYLMRRGAKTIARQIYAILQ